MKKPQTTAWFVSPRYSKEKGVTFALGHFVDRERPMTIRNYEKVGEYKTYDEAVAECERRNQKEEAK